MMLELELLLRVGAEFLRNSMVAVLAAVTEAENCADC